MTTQCLIKSSVGLITSLPCSVAGHKFTRGGLLRESLGSAESKYIRVESSMLTHHMVEGLILVQDLAIQFCVLIPRYVFLPLVRVLAISDTVQV